MPTFSDILSKDGSTNQSNYPRPQRINLNNLENLEKIGKLRIKIYINKLFILKFSSIFSF